MQTSTTRPRLLLVDSDPKSLRVLDVSLKKAGFQVLTATNGLEALAALESAPDLVISDTHMPEMDGFELCRRIKQRPEWARLPFIFLSGRKSVEEKVRGLELGVDDFLTKPIYVNELVTRVTMLLQRGHRERLESRRDPLAKYSGQLADIGVIDLVQTIEVNHKSGIIHIVSSGGRRGELYFRDGQVIDAEVGRLTGAEAVYRLFSWTHGNFEIEFKPVRHRDVVELSTQALLMEGMRRLDEWTRLLAGIPPLDRIFEVDYHRLAERLAQLPEEITGILHLFDGRRRLYQVIEDCDFPDLEALTVVGKLYGDRLIREAADSGRAPRGEATVPARIERWLNEGPTGRMATRAPADRRDDAQMDSERRTGSRAPSQEGRSDSMPPPLPEYRTSGGDIIPFPSSDTPSGSPSQQDGGRAAAVAHADNPTAARMSSSAERSEPAMGYGSSSSGARDHDQPTSGSRSSPRLASPVTAPAHTGTTGGTAHDRNHYDGPEDTLVTAMAAARRQRGLLITAGVFAGVIIVAALILRNQGRPAPSQAPVAVVAPPAPPAPVVLPPPPVAPVAAPAPAGAAPVAGTPPAVAEGVPAPAGSAPATASATPPPGAAPPVAAPGTPAPPGAAGASAPSTAPAVADAELVALKADCVKAYSKGRGKYKSIVGACAKVLEADPQAADVMVFLANAELERGATKESLEWAQRALAIDSSLPDPYVFVGNAEQIAGHRKEAKAAYEKYLELAPAGSYANDLRAVLKGL